MKRNLQVGIKYQNKKTKRRKTRLNEKEKIMEKLLSVMSKGNRIAKVRTNGTAGFIIELIELKSTGGGAVSKRYYTRFYKMLSTSIRDAEGWVEAG